MRYLLQFDRGETLRALEQSGLTLTQCKTLLLLAGGHQEPEPAAVNGLADSLGVSLSSISRAVDGLVQKRLVTRAEDERDRRVRRVAITAKGQRLADGLLAARIAGLEDFVGTLTVTQRRKLDSAVGALLDRDEIAEVYERAKEMPSR